MWQPGTSFEVILDRNGEEILIKTETMQSNSTGKRLIADDTASNTQLELRKAWLKGKLNLFFGLIFVNCNTVIN